MRNDALRFELRNAVQNGLRTAYGKHRNDGNSATGAAFVVNAGGAMTKGATSSGYNLGVRHSF